MKKSLFLLFILVTALSFSQEEPVEVPKIAIRIPMGQTVNVKNATIKFVKVLEDSRCPKDVTCVWEGRARVLVEMTETDKDKIEKELLFGQRKKNVLIASESYVLEAMALTPYPTTATVGKMEYILLVSEELK
jgi:hypothetical protein